MIFSLSLSFFKLPNDTIGVIKSRANNKKKEIKLASYKEFRTHLFKMSQYKMHTNFNGHQSF